MDNRIAILNGAMIIAGAIIIAVFLNAGLAWVILSS